MIVPFVCEKLLFVKLTVKSLDTCDSVVTSPSVKSSCFMLNAEAGKRYVFVAPFMRMSSVASVSVYEKS